jgi:hypothetical protein
VGTDSRKESIVKTPSSRRHHATRIPRAIVTTIGELISAAYETVPGMGREKAERAMELLTRSPISRHVHPHLVFVKR